MEWREMTMVQKTYREHALAAYFRVIAQQKRGGIPLDELPSRTLEKTLDECDYISMDLGQGGGGTFHHHQHSPPSVRPRGCPYEMTSRSRSTRRSRTIRPFSTRRKTCATAARWRSLLSSANKALVTASW